MLRDVDKGKNGNAGTAGFQLSEEAGATVCRLSGDWTTHTVGAVDAALRALEERDIAYLRLDLSGIRFIDTAGAWLIARLIHRQEKRGAAVEVTGPSAAAQTLLDAVAETADHPEVPSDGKRRFDPLAVFERIGRGAFLLGKDVLYSMHILGATVGGAQMKIGGRQSINPNAIVAQIDRMGVQAIPIVVLMSAIVGAIIAQQGAFQLRYFGAEIFVVDMVGILVLRELGVLLTAIMIAGRSGSAITAEIGTMKMREEVDALTVIGLNPLGVLVFPRLVALVIALPCLTIIANFAALGGAILTAWVYSDITPPAFIDRMRTAIDLSSIFAGLIKAPFMAMVIGIIASVEGMKVGGSAESLGQRVTSSVVKAIFVVIVMDGFFAMFYAAIDF
jgi:conserved hypothetical integral membrane protein